MILLASTARSGLLRQLGPSGKEQRGLDDRFGSEADLRD